MFGIFQCTSIWTETWENNMTPTDQNSNSRPNSLQAWIKSSLRKRLYINIYRYIIYPTLFTSKGETSVLVQMSCWGGCADNQTRKLGKDKQHYRPTRSKLRAPVISVAFSDRCRAAGSKLVNRKNSFPSCLNHRGPVMALQKHPVPGPSVIQRSHPTRNTVPHMLESR